MCIKRFKNNKKIIPLNYGLGETNGSFTLSDSVDGSSFFNPNHAGKDGITCELREFFSILSELKIKNINLMKINIEGGEYSLLKYIADNNSLNLVEEYQIQFHRSLLKMLKRKEMIFC